MKKLITFGLMVIMLLSFAIPAQADVTTFGFNSSRTRFAEGTAMSFLPAWQDESGLSYSQPLILKGWGAYTGKTGGIISGHYFLTNAHDMRIIRY